MEPVSDKVLAGVRFWPALTQKITESELTLTQQYVRKLINENKLSATMVGSQWVVTPEDLNDYINKYDVLIEPEDHERKTGEIPEIVALSFFSGAMGLDIGMSSDLLPEAEKSAESGCRMLI